MKRNWIRLGVAMFLVAAPTLIFAQEPQVDVLKPADLLIPAPVVEPLPPTQDVLTHSGGDVFTWKAAEPASPSDSQNDPTRAATWAFQAAPQTPRDGFEERIARLEAQVAELSRQLRSGGGPTPPPVAAAPLRMTTRAVTAAPAVAWTQAAPVARARTAAVPPASATATVAPGAPIVIHVYVHSAPAGSATTSGAAYYYSVTPPAASAAIAPQPTRVRMAVPTPGATPTIYTVPAGVAPPVTVPGVPLPDSVAPPPVSVPGQPLTPTPRSFQFIPATPATPAVPATPALPGVPGVPSPPRAATPAPPGSLAPVTITGASRVAWDDVPGEGAPKDE